MTHINAIAVAYIAVALLTVGTVIATYIVRSVFSTAAMLVLALGILSVALLLTLPIAAARTSSDAISHWSVWGSAGVLVAFVCWASYQLGLIREQLRQKYRDMHNAP
jgi:hypothetical protein